MGDAQSAQRDANNGPPAEEQREVEESTHDKQMQNNGQISECNSKQDETTADVNSPCEEIIAKEALNVEEVIGSAPEEVANVQIIQEELPEQNEEPVEIINMDAKQNDLNESFRRFFSNIGLKLTVKKGTGDQAEDEAENEGIEKLDVLEENTTEAKYEDAEQSTDLNVIQDNDSTTCPTLTEGTSENLVETEEEKITETKEMADNAEGQEANVTLFEKDGNQNINATQQSPTDQEIVSPIKKFFTTGIFATLKKKKIEDEDKELADMSKNDATAELTIPNVEEQDIECKEVPEVTVQANEPPEVEDRGKSPSTDQDSESELTSSQERVLSSPLKRLLSGTTFKRRSKRQKERRSSDSKLSDSGEQVGSQIVESSEKTEKNETVVETPSPPPSTTDPEEELSAWEAFKKLMTPKKSLTRASVGSEEVHVQTVAVEETKLKGYQISDHSTEEGRKRKDSSHSWEAVLCGSGRRRSRKTSDSEDEPKKDVGEGESPVEAGDVVTSVPKQASSPSDSESSTWKSFKKLMTPKRKAKDDEEIKDSVQSDSEATQEETLFSIKKLLSGRKKGKPGDKQDQLSSDEGDKEVVSMEEDSETPAVVPLSEFDKSETEETVKTDVEIQDSDLESEREHILEIPKTFVQEVQEHQVTPIIPLNQNQDELTEFSKYQPLSDIPEEGNVTETIATSLKEDVAKDDTIADDMVELTSEAITAPEPVDITMADETDELMLSAASHLTESSKTSGNATPVPVEYDAKDADVFLKEVVEAISTAKANTFYSEEPALDRVVSSVTHELFERCASEEQRIMEIKEQSVAVTFETGLQVDQIKDTDVEMPVTVFSENLSEFKDAISTEYVSEVSKVEFESAKIDVDEFYTAQQKRTVKQESVDDSDYMIESLSEVPEYIDVALQEESTEVLLQEKVKEIDPNDEEDSIVEIDKDEEALQEEEALIGSTEIIKTVQHDQPEAEEITDVLTVSPEGTPGLDKELSNEQAPGESVEVEIVTDGFEIVYKQDVEDIPTLEPTLEIPNFPETAVEEVRVQQEETVPVTDLVIKEDIDEDIASEEPEQNNMGEIDQDIIEQQSSKIILDANKEDVSEAISEQESKEQLANVVPEVAISQMEIFTNKLLEETSEVEVMKQIVLPIDQATLEPTTEEFSDIAELGDIPLPDFATQELRETVEEEIIEQIVEQTTDEVSREATQLDNIGELEDTLLQDVAADELVEEKLEEEHIKQIVPSSDQEIVEQTIDGDSTKAAQQDDIGELEDTLLPEVAAEKSFEEKFEEEYIKQIMPSSDQEIVEQTIDEVSTKAAQQDDIAELGDTLLPEVSADEEIIKQPVPSSDQEIVEQTIDEVSKADQQNDLGELGDIPLPQVAADEADDKVLEKFESQQQEIIPEKGTNVLNGLGLASSAEECESEAISQLHHASYVNGDHTEARPSEAQIMQIDHHYDVAEDLEALPVEHVSSVNEDSGIAQVLEDAVNIEKMSEILLTSTEEPIHEVHIGEMEVSVEEQLAEELQCLVTDVAEVKHAALLEKSTVMLQQVTPTIPDLMIPKNVEGSYEIVEDTFLPFVNNAEVLNEPKDEVHITEVEQVGIQGEKEEQIVPPETTNVDVHHELVAQLTTCSFRDIASQLPDVSIETTTAIHEPILSMVISEQEEQEVIETTTPVEVNNIIQVLQEGASVVLMQVPAVEFEDSHQVQVQVVNVDIQSAEARMDTALQIGVLEDKEVVDSCHEMVERVDSVSATSIIEQEIVNENDKVAVREVVQHVKAPPSEELPTDSDESKLSDICKMSESQDQPPDVAAIQDALIAKDQESKMDEDVKDVHEQASAENQVATPGNTVVTVPQNTGIISSVGNVESPSSLSLEFKLNIQFGQSKAPTLPPQPTHFASEQSVSSPPQSPKAAPPVDRNEPAKTTEMSEVGVQAVEEETEQENKPQKTEIVMAEAAVQATETNEEPYLMDTLKNESNDVGIQSADTEEPIEEMTAIAIIQNKTMLMDVSTQYTEISGQGEEVKPEEMAMADNQPVLIDVGTQQEETNKEVKTTVEVISSIQIAVQAEDIEEKGILQTELVVLQISKNQIKQTEDDDENQDVWMDAEEDIDAQEQITMPLCEIEESFESEPDYFQETKTDFEESLENIKQKSLKCDIDSEGEDFAVALEDPQIATAIATVEWD